MTISGALGEFALGEAESLAPDDTILPASIASAEAFGSPIVSGTVAIIGAGGIASAEAFGVPEVAESKLFLSSIDSAEAFGSPSVVMVISPTSIASAEAFGEPEVYPLITYKPVSRVM